MYTKLQNFNSRPSARGDAYTLPEHQLLVDFNSRPSARGDEISKVLAIWLSNFNSRPSARGDQATQEIQRGIAISIHAPPRGATRGRIRNSNTSYFNSRPSARGDHSAKIAIYCRDIFQFTPLREGRRCAGSGFAFFGHFNSRPSARGDTARRPRCYLQSNFNSRPSARGDQQERRNRP